MTVDITQLPQPLAQEFAKIKAKNLKLDLTRGKPSKEQLDLSDGIFSDARTIGEEDYRNYGHLEGIPEARSMFSQFVGAWPENTYVLGNSSLAVMHDLVVQMLLRPLGERHSLQKLINDGMRPVFLCPSPGYDRHFAICEKYGIEMVEIPMDRHGPDLEILRRAMRSYNVYGMWCTPKYSNPTGVTFSERVCKELASMPANPGFRIFWDLAYYWHDLTDTQDTLPNFLNLCEKAGNPDRAFVIASTSKMTHAGAGISILGSSERNLAWYRESLSVQTIGHDKLNQLRHYDFLKNNVRSHMARHRKILAPKFEAVHESLKQAFGEGGTVRWSKPNGGYFVSIYTRPGFAARVIEIAKYLGVALTPAGSAFPYGKDPHDSHIRLAPSNPPLTEVIEAMKVLILAIRIAYAERR